MDKNLLEIEDTVIKRSRALLSKKGAIHSSTYEHYVDLLNAYEKLNKDLKRLIRLSDRNQDRLNKANSKLETFSSKLSKYFSPQVYESLFSGELDVSIKPARKPLTIFFSDLQGFTGLTERLEPEQLTELLTNYLTEMSKISIKWGGTIDKYIGDAILIFFGDPVEKGVRQDAISCVSMALEMLDKIDELRYAWRERGLKIDLNVRIGIHSGICTVGNFGSEDRLDYTVIGNGVNLASRLESNAKSNTVLISEETFLLIKDKFHCETQEEITFKGISYPIQTHLVKGFKDEDAKISNSISGVVPGLKLYMDKSSIEDKDEVNKLLKSAINILAND